VTAGEDIEVLLHAETDADGASGAIAVFRGDLVLRKILPNDTAMMGQEIRRVRVDYTGPPLSRLRFYLAPVDAPGYYRLSYEGAPGPASPVPFGVCAPLPTADAPVMPNQHQSPQISHHS
jgi:hypothetical protein